jgi:hypothetical protein
MLKPLSYSLYLKGETIFASGGKQDNGLAQTLTRSIE